MCRVLAARGTLWRVYPHIKPESSPIQGDDGAHEPISTRRRARRSGGRQVRTRVGSLRQASDSTHAPQHVPLSAPSSRIITVKQTPRGISPVHPPLVSIHELILDLQHLFSQLTQSVSLFYFFFIFYWTNFSCYIFCKKFLSLIRLIWIKLWSVLLREKNEIHIIWKNLFGKMKICKLEMVAKIG